MDDLISRQAAIDAMSEVCNPSIVRFIKAKTALENIPSAEPQERTGKWMCDDSQLGIRCSECGTSFNEYVSTQDYVYLEGIPSFCPNCGADMRGEQNEP